MFKKGMRNYDDDDLLAKLLLLYFAFYNGAIGSYYIFENVETNISNVKVTINYIAPTSLWGVAFLITTVCYLLAAMQEGKNKYILMVVGGFFATAVFGVLTMAMFEMGIPMVDTIRYGVISTIHLIILMVGGVSLWRLRISNQKGGS